MPEKLNITKEQLEKELPLLGSKGFSEKYNIHVTTVSKYKRTFGISGIIRKSPERKDFRKQEGMIYDNKIILKYLGKENKLPKVLIRCLNCNEEHEQFMNSVIKPKYSSQYCKTCKPKGYDMREYKMLSESGLIVNTTLSNYKSRAKKKKIDFTLSEESFKDLIFGNCYYCNDDPNLIRTGGIHNVKGKREKCVSHYTNGIDRKDSSLGYTDENCVSCCLTCNIMKNTLNEDNFIEKIKNIYENKIKRN